MTLEPPNTRSMTDLTEAKLEQALKDADALIDQVYEEICALPRAERQAQGPRLDSAFDRCADIKAELMRRACSTPHDEREC